MSPLMMAGPYLADLRAQPDALRALRRSLEGRALDNAIAAQLRSGTWRRVVLTGMGSSLHALYPLHLVLNGCGLNCCLIETAELLLGFAPWRARDTLLVVVSQSGESAEVVALLQAAGEFGHVIGITNHPASALARVAGTVLLLQAGPEHTVSCKTYVNTLALLHWLAAELTGGEPAVATAELAAVEQPMRDYLNHTEGHVAALGGIVAGVRSVFVTGRGISLATAWTGGLILKEATRQPAEGMSCAAFRHGPFEMISEELLVLVLAGEPRVEPRHRRLVADIRRAGGQAALLAVNEASAEAFRLPAVPVPLLPLVEILPVQMLSLALAARDGREAGRFERATKITTAE